MLRTHFRPEFLNRIDEIIIFQALDRAQIKLIVGLQLERVRRMAHSQDIELVFDDSLVEHFAIEGYQPEYGARELRRQIRQRLETKLARKMLTGEIMEGSRVVSRYDQASRDIVLDVAQLAPAVPNGEGAAKSAAGTSNDSENGAQVSALSQETVASGKKSTPPDAPA